MKKKFGQYDMGKLQRAYFLSLTNIIPYSGSGHSGDMLCVVAVLAFSY